MTQKFRCIAEPKWRGKSYGDFQVGGVYHTDDIKEGIYPDDDGGVYLLDGLGEGYWMEARYFEEVTDDMLENQTQLDADEQANVETFGSLYTENALGGDRGESSERVLGLSKQPLADAMGGSANYREPQPDAVVTAEKIAEDQYLASPDGSHRVHVPGETDPDGLDAHAPGAKLDHGKLRPTLILRDMSRAIAQVAEVGTYGANKYTDGGWQHVSNGIDRYTDALYRHLLKDHAGESRDADTGLLHAAHAAWNALARLELMMREIESRNDDALQE